jgi:hypothetical protein
VKLWQRNDFHPFSEAAVIGHSRQLEADRSMTGTKAGGL